MAKILVVDDEPNLVQVVCDILEREHHTVEVARDGHEAAMKLGVGRFELAILDVMLPGIDGIEVCRSYRAGGGNALVLMLTARSSVDDTASGLDAGADDYLSKPFHVKVLLSRVRALLRRGGMTRAQQEMVRNVIIDYQARSVSRNGARLQVSAREFDLLAFLARHKGIAYTAEQLLERVWLSDTLASPDTVRTHIKNIRKKVDTPGVPSVVTHVRGYGYMVDKM
jgi:DNA-binding response OmpR family regulator